jgi:hypothetical protein
MKDHRSKIAAPERLLFDNYSRRRMAALTKRVLSFFIVLLLLLTLLPVGVLAQSTNSTGQDQQVVTPDSSAPDSSAPDSRFPVLRMRVHRLRAHQALNPRRLRPQQVQRRRSRPRIRTGGKRPPRHLPTVLRPVRRQCLEALFRA